MPDHQVGRIISTFDECCGACPVPKDNGLDWCPCEDHGCLNCGPPIRVPARYPDSGARTRCDGHMPFLLLGGGDQLPRIFPCMRRPGQHIGMDDQCECCDCTNHENRHQRLTWDRHTYSALASTLAPEQPEAQPEGGAS